MTLSCFKAYDVRGRVGVDLDEAVARAIGAAFAAVLAPASVVVGRDARESSPALARALAEGLAGAGVEVLDIGLCGTEEVYFATAHLGAGGGIMVTASHNPKGWNGMKLVGSGSRPLTDGEFRAVGEAAAAVGQGSGSESDGGTLGETAGSPGVGRGSPRHATGGTAGQTRGRVVPTDTQGTYAAHVAGFVEAAALGRASGPLTILADAGNGTAGAALDAVAAELERRGARLRIIRQRHEPDGAFPHGIPNPLLPENRGMTARGVLEAGADLGVAWDGDFDRCFLFDEKGGFVDGEYVVALLAEAVLAREPGAAIVHDPRVVFATADAIRRGGGRAVAAKTGHAFVKAAMREAGAAYGGEMSAHHYFRNFFFCDSGMIPWLVVAELLSRTGRTLSEAVASLRARFPSSGEINFTVPDPKATVETVLARLGPEASSVGRLDGASLDFGAWRMNLRASNTEPLLRLNLETRGDPALLDRKLAEVRALIEAG